MEQIKEQIFDIFNDNSTKLQNLLILYNDSQNRETELTHNGSDLFLETLNTLTNIYNMQPTIIGLNLLILLLNSNICNIYKIQILECIYLENQILCIFYIYKFFIINNIFNNNFIFINLLKYILQKNTFFDELLNDVKVFDDSLLILNYETIANYFITNIFENNNIELTDRYKITVDFCNNINTCDFYIYKFYNYWVFNQNINSFKILASQYLLMNYDPNSLTPIESENLREPAPHNIYCELLNICNNNELDYNLRADSADLLVRYGTTNIKNIARDIIILLGKDNYKFKTIYNNKQNVHNIQIDNSIKIYLDTLNNINIQNLNIDDINNYLLTLKNYTQPEINAINGSILRIKIDNCKYNNLSLLNIFYKIYSKVINYNEPQKSTLLFRINEELIDMFNTCSSGHVSRLVNVLSGFEDTIKISFYDQIKSNLFARLYKRIQDIPLNTNYKIIKITDANNNYITQKIKMEMHEVEEYQNNILSEFTTINKSNLLKFLNDNILDIHKELYMEFVPVYLNDDTFTEYMRKAIMEFEDNN